MSIDSGPGPVVSRRLGYLFKHAAMRMEKLNTEALAPFGIDARELGILLVIASHEPGSQQQAAKGAGIDRTSMVARIDALEDKGLVSRHPHAEGPAAQRGRAHQRRARHRPTGRRGERAR